MTFRAPDPCISCSSSGQCAPIASAPDRVRTYVKYGASPRAAIGLAEAVRVHALMYGKPSVGAEDVRALAKHVLGHRIALDYRAKLDGVSVWTLIDDVLGQETL